MSGIMLDFPHGPGGDGKLASNGRGDDPLRRFTLAKKAIGDIYGDLEMEVNNLAQFFEDLCSHFSFVPDSPLKEVSRLRDSILTIKDMFKRDHMKVVFFGRTSNGKSSTINAMLHSKILPQGMGHTTCCFLQVEGGAGQEKYLLAEGSNERLDIAMLPRLGHALSEKNSSLPAMGQDSLLRVFYPKSASKLLQNEVVLVDSPGVDVSPEFDSWIDKHCLDADVFVLVCNAESTLTQAEKAFFHRVNAKLSRPNIFILNNRWDASASEPDCDQVKEQHLHRLKHFLVEELAVCTAKDADDRIFFVSAREMLDARLKVKNPFQLDGFQRRAYDFSQFEQQFESCISKSAIRTKFEAHDRRAREIIETMRANIANVTEMIHQEQLAKHAELEKKQAELDGGRRAFLRFEELCREQADRLRAEVHLKVEADFCEEIQRLPAIIDKFDHAFIDEPHAIAEYKEALSAFVDDVVTRELEERCTGGLLQRIWKLENDMFKHVNGILAPPYPQRLEEVWKFKSPMQFKIRVNCPALIADFREDLEFRFSFGVSALMRRFIAFRSGQPITAIGDPSRKGLAITGETKGQELAGIDVDQAVLVNSLVLSTASYVANGGVGLIIVCGLVYRTVGWRVIAAGAGVYGGLYLIERLRWNSHAKEQHLKEQMRSHLAVRMRQVAASHTANCEMQALGELEAAEKGLKTAVGGFHQEMKSAMDAVRSAIEQMQKMSKALGEVKGKTALFLARLDAFRADFLKAESPGVSS